MKRQPERVFIFRLAKELGKTVRELLSELDSREIAEWLAFFKLEKEAPELNQKAATTDKLKATLKHIVPKT
jgi:hypothetical protein